MKEKHIVLDLAGACAADILTIEIRFGGTPVFKQAADESKIGGAPLTGADRQFLALWRQRLGEGRASSRQLAEIAQPINGLRVLRATGGTVSLRSLGKYVRCLKRARLPGIQISGPFHLKEGAYWQLTLSSDYMSCS
jgi:hypothetical protein